MRESEELEEFGEQWTIKDVDLCLIRMGKDLKPEKRCTVWCWLAGTSFIVVPRKLHFHYLLNPLQCNRLSKTEKSIRSLGMGQQQNTPGNSNCAFVFTLAAVVAVDKIYSLLHSHSTFIINSSIPHAWCSPVEWRGSCKRPTLSCFSFLLILHAYFACISVPLYD